MYAVIDIETTGRFARQEKITEIAIYLHDGEKITGEFITLVNPERIIPYYITSLTGITNEMVENAPRFYEIARTIVELTDGRTIVAHNARFDYSFLREEFKSLGYNFRRKVIDTISLTRKLFPGYKSYSLGNICSALGIAIYGRHRAAGDAMATVRLLEMCLTKDREFNGICSELIKNTKLSKLNPLLDYKKIEQIPEGPGIYFFYDENGNVIYVGKSNNLYERINTHLSNNTSRKAMKMRDEIADISWEPTGSELIALIRESFEIKTLKPVYNRAQRKLCNRWGIFQSINEHGYIVFTLNRVKGRMPCIAMFNSKENAKAALLRLTEKFTLCQKLVGLYETEGSCFHYQVGMCLGACCGKESPLDYNKRASKAINEFTFSPGNYFIIDRGRDENERSVVKIVKGRFVGYGYFDINCVGFGLDAIHECIKEANDNSEILSIIKSYLSHNKVEKIIEF
ncbi:MAG: exonuclease domain-containing protein [Bacteroidales bacterium]